MKKEIFKIGLGLLILNSLSVASEVNFGNKYLQETINFLEQKEEEKSYFDDNQKNPNVQLWSGLGIKIKKDIISKQVSSKYVNNYILCTLEDKKIETCYYRHKITGVYKEVIKKDIETNTTLSKIIFSSIGWNIYGIKRLEDYQNKRTIYFYDSNINKIKSIVTSDKNSNTMNFYKNGKIQEVIPYSNGEKNGFHQKFDENGNLTYQQEYKNGKSVKED